MVAAADGIRVDLSGLRDAANDWCLPLFVDQHRFLVLLGGAGSGKSVFAAQKQLIRCVTEPQSRHLIIRKVAKTLRESCFAELCSLIARAGWLPHFVVNRAELRITFGPTGSQLVFVGMDDAEKIKSIQGITSAWIEEATELARDDFRQINLRLRGTTPTYHQIILTFNPISARHWLRQEFPDGCADERVKMVRTTYRDNRFVDTQYKAEIEALRNRDEMMYQVYGLGEWGVLHGQIYRLPVMDLWPARFDQTIYGLDFGFNNPCALVEENLHDGEAYEREMLYQTHLTTEDLILRMKDLPLVPYAPIYADAAEPDRIEAIAKAGFNVFPCLKGQGSVNAGIAFVKGLRIHGHADNVNLNAEVEGYVWAKDRNGLSLDEPVKFNDHAMDARRYALFTHLSRAAGSWDEVRVTGPKFSLPDALHETPHARLSTPLAELKDF